MGQRRDQVVRDQIAYERAERKRLALEDKIVESIARQIVGVLQSKYDSRLVVNCQESALIALYRDGVLPPTKVPRRIKKGRKRLFVEMALRRLVDEQVITVAILPSEYVLQTTQPVVVPTQREEGVNYYERYGLPEDHPPYIAARLKRWERKAA